MSNPEQITDVYSAQDIVDALRAETAQAAKRTPLELAAPDLLRELQSAVDMMDRARAFLHRVHWGILDTTKARAAIAKTESEATDQTQ